jgi:hypothetical protein
MTSNIDNDDQFPATVQEDRPLVLSEFHLRGLVNSVTNGSLMEEHDATSMIMSFALFRSDETGLADSKFVLGVDCELPNGEELSVDLVETMIEVLNDTTHAPYTDVVTEISAQCLKDVAADVFREFAEESPEDCPFIAAEKYFMRSFAELHHKFLNVPIDSSPAFVVTFNRDENNVCASVKLFQDSNEVNGSFVRIGSVSQ